MQLQRRPIAAPACLPDKVSKSINYKNGTTQIAKFRKFSKQKIMVKSELE